MTFNTIDGVTVTCDIEQIKSISSECNTFGNPREPVPGSSRWRVDIGSSVFLVTEDVWKPIAAQVTGMTVEELEAMWAAKSVDPPRMYGLTVKGSHRLLKDLQQTMRDLDGVLVDDVRLDPEFAGRWQMSTLGFRPYTLGGKEAAYIKDSLPEIILED
jgi:hypothetical protein